MDSVFETTNNAFRNHEYTNNNTKNDCIEESIENETLDNNLDKKGQSKFVQFGNTYVLNTSISKSPSNSMTESQSPDEVFTKKKIKC